MENMHKVLNKVNKSWSANGLDTLIKRNDNTGGTVIDRTYGSGRPNSLNQKINHQTAMTGRIQHFGKFVTKSTLQSIRDMHHLKDLLQETGNCLNTRLMHASISLDIFYSDVKSRLI